MIPLIDGDILAYEIPFACEYNKEEIPGFDYVYTVLQSRIQGICTAVGATEAPVIFLTGEGNFRDEVAFTKPYKGTRKGEKPFHYENIRAVLRAVYGAEEVVGYEADDAMAIAQTANAYSCSQQALGDHSFTQTVICSRDKDLRMVTGYHYGWESGRQGEFDLQYIDEVGYLDLNVEKKKVEGGGLMFFYAQMLMGDGVDNIPGCKGVGYKKAYDLLSDLTEPLEMEQVVWDTYKLKHPDKPLEELTALFMEQAYLLWMVREFNPDGSLKMWEPSIELA
jgi:hypothetical protein